MILFRAAFFVILIFFSPAAMAQGYSLYCDATDSTAATQACLTKHLEAAQDRLNSIYKELNDKLTAEKKKELQELQKVWLQYRDAECMWEAQKPLEDTLKRLNELSCMARVTEDRADTLSVVHSGYLSEGMAKWQYGSFPRWMNALAQDHPEIKWNYGGRQTYDLNCDGTAEQIMQGVVTKSATGASIEDKDKGLQNFSQEIVIAVVQNPLIGRPKAHLVRYPVKLEKSEEGICSDAAFFEFSGGKNNDLCEAKLLVKAKNCLTKEIIWQDKKFVPFKVEKIIKK